MFSRGWFGPTEGAVERAMFRGRLPLASHRGRTLHMWSERERERETERPGAAGLDSLGQTRPHPRGSAPRVTVRLESPPDDIAPRQHPVKRKNERERERECRLTALTRDEVVRKAVVETALELKEVLGVCEKVGVAGVEVVVRLGGRVGETDCSRGEYGRAGGRKV